MVKELMLTVTLRPEPEGGFSVFCNELDVASQGETVEESIKNIREAVELYIESAEDLGIMDEVIEKLGLSKEDMKKNVLAPRTLTTNLPIEVSI